MGDASVFKYPSPLTGYDDAPPMPSEMAADGKSYVNPPSEKRSDAYDQFIEPLDRSERGGLWVIMNRMVRIAIDTHSDVHIYYLQSNEEQTKYAKELWERIRRECKRYYPQFYVAPDSNTLSLRAASLQNLG